MPPAVGNPNEGSPTRLGPRHARMPTIGVVAWATWMARQPPNARHLAKPGEAVEVAGEAWQAIARRCTRGERHHQRGADHEPEQDRDEDGRTARRRG
ncbi:hypothetical protein ACU686_10010 [Yinghuangia aomiensis]